MIRNLQSTAGTDTCTNSVSIHISTAPVFVELMHQTVTLGFKNVECFLKIVILSSASNLPVTNENLASHELDEVHIFKI